MLIEQDSLKEKIRDKDRIIEQLKNRGKEGFADREIIEEKDFEISKLKEEITLLKKQMNLQGGQILAPGKISHVKGVNEPWGTNSGVSNSQAQQPKSEQKWGQGDSGLHKSGSWVPNSAIKSFIINPADTLYSSNSKCNIQIRRSLPYQMIVMMIKSELARIRTNRDQAGSLQRSKIM